MHPIITLRKNEERRIIAGHLWAFSNEIQEISGEPAAGDIAELRTHAGKFIGLGFYNPRSLIAFRVLTREREEITFDFFRKRISSATSLRDRMYGGDAACRLVHGESDFLPGLVIDRYGDQLALQTLSFGMDRRLTLIADVLDSLFHPKGIIERNDVHVRELEGLEQKKGVLRGEAGPVVITEHGIKYSIDPLEGQKTGFFLDQRENRKAVRRYAQGVRVLDAFCNDGGFALNAASAGAAGVSAVDISETAIERARKNAGLNQLTAAVEFTAADCFDHMRAAAAGQERFGLIILDPPSFTKSRKNVTQAKQGYRELHTLALALLAPEGILATASCSHHILEETFVSVIANCAVSAGKNIRLLDWRGAAPDHPVLPAMPETRYLKFGIFQVY